MSDRELQLIIERLRKNYRYCQLNLKRAKRYDLQKQLEGRIAAYEIALRLHGVSLETESDSGLGGLK